MENKKDVKWCYDGDVCFFSEQPSCKNCSILNNDGTLKSNATTNEDIED